MLVFVVKRGSRFTIGDNVVVEVIDAKGGR